MAKKRTVKQWIMRYIFIVAIISLVATVTISSAKAAYRSSVSSIDTARVAIWKFTLNDGEISSHDSTPINMLKDSNYKHVSVYDDGTHSSLVPGMTGSIDYVLKNESEVNAILSKLSIKMNIKVNKITSTEASYNEKDWEKWLQAMPISWYITVIDQEDDGITSSTIVLPVDSCLTGIKFESDGLTAKVISYWDIITEDSTGLEFNMGESLKIIRINWDWPFNRHDAYTFYNEKVTNAGSQKSINYDGYLNHAEHEHIDDKTIIDHPLFTYTVGEEQITDKRYETMTINDYVNLHKYCTSVNNYQQMYKYLNYTEYLKWKNYYIVPDNFMTSESDNCIRQSYYLDELDTLFSNLKVDIEFLLSFTVEQAVPTNE